MARGSPSIDNLRDPAQRVLIGIISNIRQRIEAAEAALTVLEGLPNTSAASIVALQAQLRALTLATGTVTSVSATVPSFLSVSGVPVTGQGTIALALATQAAATVFAGPASGSAAAPTFRAIAQTDLPALDWLEVFSDYTLTEDDAGQGLAATANSGGQNIVVPGEDVPFPIGKTVLLVQEGAASVSVVAVSGVQLLRRADRTPVLAGPGSVVWLTKRAADSWLLYGDLAP